MEAKIKKILSLTGEIKPKDHDLIERAYSFALKAHEGQKRMSGEPYFLHVFETAKILAEMGMDAETIAAGFLHDVLEDTDILEEKLKAEFGTEILFLVKGVTKLGTLKYHGHERHVESLRKFFVAMANDLRVVVIKFADRLHNLRTLEFVREDKRRRIALESLEVYAPLANRLGIGNIRGEIEDAAFPYVYPKEYVEVEEIIKEKKDLYHKYLAEIRENLLKELKKNKIAFQNVDYRVKHKYSLWKKLLKYDMDLGKIHDIVALRVVVNTVEECYRVLGIIHAIWSPLPGRIKDYIAVPKPNSYRSIHTTIFTGSGGIAEIQIRTREMHEEAAYGVTAHFVYKEQRGKKSLNEKSKFKWVEELKNFKSLSKDPQQYMDHIKMDFFNDRIFIFTPTGDVVDLPEGSSPVDFAYAIHSDLGHHTAGVKINGKMSQIFTELHNGDRVEIIKKRDARPSSKWLEYTKTTIAKKHIRSYLDKHNLFSRLKSIGN